MGSLEHGAVQEQCSCRCSETIHDGKQIQDRQHGCSFIFSLLTTCEIYVGRFLFFPAFWSLRRLRLESHDFWQGLQEVIQKKRRVSVVQPVCCTCSAPYGRKGWWRGWHCKPSHSSTPRSPQLPLPVSAWCFPQAQMLLAPLCRPLFPGRLEWQRNREQAFSKESWKQQLPSPSTLQKAREPMWDRKSVV